MEPISKPGVYVISNTEYHSAGVCVEPCLSTSIIKDLIYECPKQAWWNHPKLNPDYKPDNGDGKFDLGSAAHEFLLEVEKSVQVFDKIDDWRTKAAQSAREECWATGKIPLLRKHYDQVSAMCEAAEWQIRECKELGIKNLREEGDSELSYAWKEGDTWMKVRPDWLRKDRKLKIAYKTTGLSVNPSGLGRHIANMGFDIGYALYQRGIKAIDGIEPKTVFVFQSTEPPYLCSFISLPPEYVMLAKSKVDYGIFLWNQCMESGNWPTYPSRVAYVDCPPWELARWESIAQDIGFEPEAKPLKWERS